MLSFEELAFMNVSTNLSSDLNKPMVNTSYGAIRIGLYHRYVRRWLKYFDLKRVHFVNGERLVSDPASETNAVERFLGLKPSIDRSHFVYPSSARFPCLKKGDKTPRCLGKTKGRQHPKVDTKLLRVLEEFYKPHNERLFELIGRRFEW